MDHIKQILYSEYCANLKPFITGSRIASCWKSCKSRYLKTSLRIIYELEFINLKVTEIRFKFDKTKF